jgi:hypothetical protein
MYRQWQQLKQVQCWNEAAGAIYADCVQSIAMTEKVEFQHCSREANIAVHVIATHSFNLKLSCNWIDEPPSFLLQTLMDDVTII